MRAFFQCTIIHPLSLVIFYAKHFQEDANKEAVETTMCDIDQELGVEERNKKRTFKYYCKMIESSKNGKSEYNEAMKKISLILHTVLAFMRLFAASAEQKSMMSRVVQELTESNERLEFLQMARKYLEVCGFIHD